MTERLIDRIRRITRADSTPEAEAAFREACEREWGALVGLIEQAASEKKALLSTRLDSAEVAYELVRRLKHEGFRARAGTLKTGGAALEVAW
jgi:alpha-glucuronidase